MVRFAGLQAGHGFRIAHVVGVLDLPAHRRIAGRSLAVHIDAVIRYQCRPPGAGRR